MLRLYNVVSGQTVKVPSINQFCLDHGYDRRNIVKAIHHKKVQHGWINAKVRRKTYKIKNLLTGETCEERTVRKLAAKVGLSYKVLHKMFVGQRLQFNDWVLDTTDDILSESKLTKSTGSLLSRL